jgi:hypothetical protein
VKILKSLVDLNEILSCGNDIEGDRYHSIMAVCLTVSHYLLNHLVNFHEIW